MSRRGGPSSSASGAAGAPNGASVLGASSIGLRPAAPRYTLGLSRPAVPSSSSRAQRLSSGGSGVPDDIPRAPSFSAYETLDAAEFCYDLRERIGAALGRPPPRASLAASRSAAKSSTAASNAPLQPTEQDMPDDLAAILAPQPKRRRDPAALKHDPSSGEDQLRLSNSEWLQRAEAAHAARQASRAQAREAAVQTEMPLPHLRAGGTSHAGPSSEIIMPGSTPREAASVHTPGAAVDRARLAGRAVEELLGIGGVAPEGGESLALAESFVPLAGEGDGQADADAEADDDVAGPSALFDAPGGIEEVLRRRAQLAEAQAAPSSDASVESGKRRAPLIEELRQDTPTLEEILQRNAAEMGGEDEEQEIGSDSESEESSDEEEEEEEEDGSPDDEEAESEDEEEEDEEEEELEEELEPRGGVHLPITNGTSSRRLILDEAEDEDDLEDEEEDEEDEEEDEDEDGLGEEEEDASDMDEPSQSAQPAADEVIELLDSDSEEERTPSPVPQRAPAPAFAPQEALMAAHGADEHTDEMDASHERAPALWQEQQRAEHLTPANADAQLQQDEQQDETWDAHAAPPPPFEQLADAAMSRAPIDFGQSSALPHSFQSSAQPFSDSLAVASTESGSSMPAAQLDPALFGLTGESGEGSAAGTPSVAEPAQVQNWGWSLGQHTPAASAEHESGFFSDLLHDRSSSMEPPLQPPASGLALDESAIAAAVHAAEAHASSQASSSVAPALPPGTPGSERPAPELLNLASNPAPSSAALLRLKDQVTSGRSMASSLASEASAVKRQQSAESPAPGASAAPINLTSSSDGGLAQPINLVSSDGSLVQPDVGNSTAGAETPTGLAASAAQGTAPSTPSAVPLLSRQVVSSEPAIPAEGAALLAFKREHATLPSASSSASLAATEGAVSTATPLGTAVTLPLRDASALASFKAQLSEQPGHPQSIASVAGSDAHRSAPHTPVAEGMPVASAQQLLAFKKEVESNGALASAASSQAGSDGRRSAALPTAGLPATPVSAGTPAVGGTLGAAPPADQDPLVADARELIALKAEIEEDKDEMPRVSAAPSLAGSEHEPVPPSRILLPTRAHIAGALLAGWASDAPSSAASDVEEVPEATELASTHDEVQDSAEPAEDSVEQAEPSAPASAVQDDLEAAAQDDELSTPVAEAVTDEVVLLPKSQPSASDSSSQPMEHSSEAREEAAASLEDAIGVKTGSPPRIEGSPLPVETSEVPEEAPASGDALTSGAGALPEAKEAEVAASASDAALARPTSPVAVAAPASPAVRRSSPRKRAASPIVGDSSNSSAAEHKPSRSVKRKVEEPSSEVGGQALEADSSASEPNAGTAAAGFVSKASGFLAQMLNLRRNRHFHHHGAGPAARVGSSPRSARSATPASIKGTTAAGSSPMKAVTPSAGNSSDVEMAEAEPSVRNGSSVTSEQAVAAASSDGLLVVDEEMRDAEEEEEEVSADGYLGPATRSRCSYHLITLPSATSANGRCTFAVPGCSIAHDKLAKEDARHLGPASASDNETKEWFDPQMLPGELYHALSRICDIDLLEDVAIMPATKPEGVRSWLDDAILPEDEQGSSNDPQLAPKGWLRQEGASSPLSTPPPPGQHEPVAAEEEMRSPSLPPKTRGADLVSVEIDVPAPSARQQSRASRRSSGKTRATPEASSSRVAAEEAGDASQAGPSTSPQTPKRTRRTLRHPRRSDPAGPDANYQPRESDSDDEPRSRRSSRRAGSQASPGAPADTAGDDADLSIASLEQRASAPPPTHDAENELVVPAARAKRTYPRRKPSDASYRERIADPSAPPESEEEDVAEREAQQAAAESARRASARRRAERQKAERADGREVEAELALEAAQGASGRLSRSGSTKGRRRAAADPAFKPAAGSENDDGASSDEQAQASSSRISPARPKPRPRVARKSSTAARSTPRASSAKASTPDVGSQSVEPADAAGSASPGPSSSRSAAPRRSGRARRVSRDAE